MNESTQLVDRASLRSPRLFTPSDRVGLVVLIIGVLAGLWLMVAPFIVGYQDRNAHWAAGTENDFLVGGALAALMLAMIVWLIGGSLLELSHTASPRHRDPNQSDRASTTAT